MATHASTLLSLAIVVGLASGASYLLGQWRVRRGDATFALAGMGVGTALLLAAVFLVVLGVVLLSQQWLSRLKETASSNETAVGDIVTRPNPFAAVQIESPAHLDIEWDGGHNSRALRTQTASAARGGPHQQTQERSARAAASPRPPAASDPREQNGGVLSASDPWAATRCVVPLKREWSDGTRWTIVNDCGVAVAILIATCERPANACSNGAWRYPAEGLQLPAKVQRPTIEAEETLHAIELRHAACVVTDSIALDLIGIEPPARTQQWQRDFEAAQARDTCLHEVRWLAALGARSGVSLDALFGGTLFSRAGQ